MSGLGALVNEQMFGANTMYRNVRARGTGASATVASAYFFSSPSVLALNANWPLAVTQVALTTDPFNNGISQLWTDVSGRVQSLDSSRGRQYELDLVSAGEAAVTLYDPDEAFNPTNPTSPYYPNVKVYRRIIDQAMWPPAPVGGAVNTLNAAAGFDMSFESYAIGSTPPWVLDFGNVTPVITTTNPFQGSRCLTWNITAAAGLQGIVFNFACIPGQVYTASVYLRQSFGNVHELRLNGHTNMATTSVAGSYVRLTGTFTADQPTLQLCIDSTPAGSAQVFVDAIQLEPGGTASPFSASGPTIYSVFGGFVERWPSSWNFHGTYGMAQLTAVDAFAPMAGQALFTEVRNSILAKAPDYYWPLSEAQGATTFVEASGNQGPTMVELVRPSVFVGNTPFTFTAGTQTNLPGDPSGVGLTVTGPGNSPGNWVVARAAGPPGTSFTPPAINVPTGTSWSFSFWAAHTTPVQSTTMVAGGATVSPNTNSFSVNLFIGPPEVQFIMAVPGNASLWATSSGVTDVWADGKMHYYAGVMVVTGANITATFYVDGAQVYNISAAGFTPGPSWTVQYLDVGAAMDPYDSVATEPVQGGLFAHVALWNRGLSAGEIADLFSAGQNGYSGERSDQRIARYLGYHYIAPSSLETGASVMGISDLAADTSLLDACQNVTTSENGVLVVDPGGSGTVSFQARTHRYLETSASWVFGENAAGGEIPYLDSIAFDYDPTQVYNDVQVTRSGGVVAIGGSASLVSASRLSYGKRSLQRTINVLSDLETIDAANWLFTSHQSPRQRLAQLIINPAANPSIWPAALGVKIGDRATVKRRTSAGYVMNLDFFVERIEHTRNNAGQWQVTYQMSPAGNAFNLQPWILGHATFGVLDSTTVLGY